MSKPQDLRNHARYEPLYHQVLLPITMVLLIRAFATIRPLSWDSVERLLTAVALFLVTWHARAFPLMAQNRVIRLEERLRLQRLAPELAARFDQLKPGQVVALRFAGDEEFPDLVRQVLEGRLTTGAQIKAAVKEWRADHLRV